MWLCGITHAHICEGLGLVSNTKEGKKKGEKARERENLDQRGKHLYGII